MIETINTPALAFVAGAITSVHCAGMCGPIACSLTALKKEESSRYGAAVFYHGGRLVSYAGIGAMLGAVGSKPLEFFHHSSMSFLPWVLVGVFIAIALGLEKKIPRPAFLDRWAARLRFKAMKVSASKGALAMGLATPLLPCAPLYIFFAVCLATGSAIQGAEFALSFGLGTVPLLWATQLGMQKLQLKLGPKYVTLLQRGLAVIAALFIAKRLLFDPTPLLLPEPATPGAEPTEQSAPQASPDGKYG
ncbi:MAG: sulfite exporter TauE/SafE family protein [Akkermansiaceae bacterium]|nr:sulfite exporter TauE/SafE family protein [Akkermansiaceae bacterium]